MKVCPACMRQNDDAAAFCSGCGRNFEQATAAPPPLGTQEVSTMAVVSLIFGLLFFIFPAAVVAVILGHISSSQIRKSAGRLKGAGMALAGMIMGYVGIAVLPAILIIAAITVPNLLKARMVANEATAESNLRTIATAAISYQEEYHQFPPSFSALGPPPSGKVPDADGAALLGEMLVRGSENGYHFQYHPVSSHHDGTIDGFDASADPINPGATGSRHFHIDESFELRANSSGPAGRDSPALE